MNKKTRIFMRVLCAALVAQLAALLFLIDETLQETVDMRATLVTLIFIVSIAVAAFAAYQFTKENPDAN